MKARCLAVLILARLVSAHGDHGTGMRPGEDIKAYAQRHMATEHHIESFDLRSFFQLHDLNRDGWWDREEIEAIYGVHHVYSQKKSKDDEEHQKKADHISGTVLNMLDKDHDGRVSPEEFEAVGLEGLPNFESLGAEGHHYDVESEFFLHHEEEFHSTPETQTDESYNHPEDLEHFAHHESIERKEAEKEAEFQGISVDEALAAHDPPKEEPGSVEGEHVATPEDEGQHPVAVPHPHDEQIEAQPPVVEPPANAAPDSGKPKLTRTTPPEKMDPKERYRNAKAEPRADWGTGSEGYKPPKNAGDKLRKNLPYKYKFKRNWGDF
ncbi:Precursor to secretory protein [Mycena indigotica]|uniref:Precursor to secretory protein n=1 Tax=Mycena indigotica TaxID=2126181 RepID=A0A8H6WA84_9AGAR|nr:Precursor to secretory protein [Mycena indigotica]KAF7307368.1 Precursor to secretory protein [Mycena indigotica]